MGHIEGGINWGRIPPERRGRWGRWLYQKRWENGRQTQNSVRATMAKMGSPISPSYYSEIEGGTVPNEDWQAVFIRLWGSEPPPEPQPAPTDTRDAVVANLQALTAAMTAQAEALREIVEEMRVERETRKGHDEALAISLDALSEQLAALRPVLAGRSR